MSGKRIGRVRPKVVAMETGATPHDIPGAVTLDTSTYGAT
jgi:hypothetical protein